jgi:pantoate--beta-alanine ligase
MVNTLSVFKKRADLKRFLHSVPNSSGEIGFVPTMGALHAGHLDLVRRSLACSSRTVVSIFVNPTQFNQAQDLEKYPRQAEKDLDLLSSIGDLVVFLPEVEEIYPPGEDVHVPLDLGSLGDVMEGKFRPGHFEGVAQVVKRLLDIVEPRRLFMGQKDLQQVRVVDKLIKTYGIPVDLIACPTVRERSGLAMSSRNQRLSDDEKQRASLIFQSLTQAKDRYLDGIPPSKVMEEGFQSLKKAGFKVEYFELVEAEHLIRLQDDDPRTAFAVCTAAGLGAVRLIDNVLGKP